MSAWCIQILGGQVSITKRYYLMGPGGHESCMPDIAESTTDNRRLGLTSLAPRMVILGIFVRWSSFKLKDGQCSSETTDIT